MYYYALTLRKTRLPITTTLYEDYISRLVKKLRTFDVIEYHYELEEGLHYHALVASLYKLKKQSIKLEMYGWSWQLVDITHFDGWMTYIRKDIIKAGELMRHFLVTEDDRIPAHFTLEERMEYARTVLGLPQDEGSEDDSTAWYKKIRLV